jgi:IS30 family transposase
VIESRQTKANESYPSQFGETQAEIRVLRAAGVSQRELMKRYSVSKATIIKYAAAKKKCFKEYAPGFIHIDIKHLSRMPDETSRRYLFVVIDRASRWVFLHIYDDQSEESSLDFLKHLQAACPIHIRTILTDNGAQFHRQLHFPAKATFRQSCL